MECEGWRARVTNFTDACPVMGQHLSQDSELAQEILTGYCCSPPVVAAEGMLRKLRIGGFSFGGMLWSTVLNSVFLFVSQQLMKCACFQKKTKRLRHEVEIAGYVCFGVLVCIMLPEVVWGVYYLHRLGRLMHALINFFGGQVGAILGVTVINSLQFLVLRYIQLPKQRGGILKCLDPPESHRDHQDERNFIAKFVNPRFRVSASEHMAWAPSFDNSAYVQSSSNSDVDSS